MQASPLIDHRRDIYEALVESAVLEGSQGHQDRKLALQLLGDFSQEEEKRQVAEFTADELAQAEKEIAEFEAGADE